MCYSFLIIVILKYKIAMVSGIDMFFFGPADFAHSLGIPCDLDDRGLDAWRMIKKSDLHIQQITFFILRFNQFIVQCIVIYNNLASIRICSFKYIFVNHFVAFHKFILKE